MVVAGPSAPTAVASPHFFRVLFVCACIAVLDGYDTQAIAFVAPVLTTEWGVGKEAFGIAFAAALIGLTVGTTILGPLADRLGRKPVLIISVAIFGAFSLATALSSTLEELAAWRFLTGIGLGAAIPNLMALTSEHAPLHRRALSIGVMFCGFPVGAMACGLLSPSVIESHGWQSVFVIGGIIPLAFVPIASIMLVESPLWIRGAKKENVNTASVHTLFTKEFLSITPLLWSTFFCSLLVMYFLINWLPTIFIDAGQNLRQATHTTVVLNIGGIIGGLLLTPLIDRFGARRILPYAYFSGALCIAGIGFLSPGSVSIMSAILIAGITIVGGQLGANAYAANVHPTHLRATGVGWALGVGRVGSIIGPVFGGLLLGSGMKIEHLFLVVAIVASAAACMLLILTNKHHEG